MLTSSDVFLSAKVNKEKVILVFLKDLRQQYKIRCLCEQTLMFFMQYCYLPVAKAYGENGITDPRRKKMLLMQLLLYIV
jgi:hypothetical protein